jgi:hypothetical protein
MARNGTVTLDLPNCALAELQLLAGRQKSSLDGLVCEIIDNWLEGRRRDVRLGKGAGQAQVVSLRTNGGRKG